MVEDKDLELLGEKPSSLRTDSMAERIARLRRELARGEMVYTVAELHILKLRLEEYERLLEMIQHQ